MKVEYAISVDLEAFLRRKELLDRVVEVAKQASRGGFVDVDSTVVSLLRYGLKGTQTAEVALPLTACEVTTQIDGADGKCPAAITVHDKFSHPYQSRPPYDDGNT